MTKLLPSNFELDRYGLHCRLVNEGDAEFIVQLRSDPKLGRFLHASDGDVQKQIEWTQEYKKREAEGLDYYFVFEINGIKQGVCRIYNIHEQDFTSGSWIFSPDAEKGTAILGDIISREIAFELFPDSLNLFDIRKDNKTVQRYALTYHPTFLREDEEGNVYYSESKEIFEKYKKIYTRMAKY